MRICICKWTSPQSAHFWLASVWHRSSELVSNSELTRSHGRHGYVTSHTGQLSHLSITALAMSSAICNWITLVRKVTAERRGPPPVATTSVCSLLAQDHWNRDGSLLPQALDSSSHLNYLLTSNYIFTVPKVIHDLINLYPAAGLRPPSTSRNSPFFPVLKISLKIRP